MKNLCLLFLFIFFGFLIFSQSVFAKVTDFEVWPFSSVYGLSGYNYHNDWYLGHFANTRENDGVAVDYGRIQNLAPDTPYGIGTADLVVPFNISSAGYSSSFWFYPPSEGNLPGWIKNGTSVDNSVNLMGYKYFLNSSDVFTMDYVWNDGLTGGFSSCTNHNAVISRDDWNLFVFNISPIDYEVYINNNLAYSCSFNSSVDFSVYDEWLGFSMNVDNGLDSSKLRSISEFAVYNTILTSDERSALWNNGAGARVLDVFSIGSGSGGDPVSYDDPSDLEDYWYCYAGDVISGIDNKIDCLAENTYPGLAIDNAVWIETTSTCHEYVCGYFENPQYSSTDIFEVDLDSQLTDFTTQFECEANGGYWWTFPPPSEGCYELVPVSAWSDVSHLFFGWDPSSYASTSPDMVSWLDISVTTSTPAKILEAPNKWLALITHRFPFNVVSQYILFWYKMLDAVQSNNSSINYYSYSADISFFPGQEETQNYTLMDFNQPGLSDTPITLLGLNFSSFYSFCRLFFKFFLYLAFGAYCLKFGTRLFSNN